MDSDNLRAQRDATAQATAQARRIRSKERDDRLSEFTKTLDAELDAKHDADFAQLRKAERAALIAWENAEIASARVKVDAMPVRRFEEWRMRKLSAFRLGDAAPSGRIGVLEVCTRESRFAENVSDYAQPDVGDIFLRILKSDGTPSLLFERYFNTERWRPAAVQKVDTPDAPPPPPPASR